MSLKKKLLPGVLSEIGARRSAISAENALNPRPSGKCLGWQKMALGLRPRAIFSQPRHFQLCPRISGHFVDENGRVTSHFARKWTRFELCARKWARILWKWTRAQPEYIFKGSETIFQQSENRVLFLAKWRVTSANFRTKFEALPLAAPLWYNCK